MQTDGNGALGNFGRGVVHDGIKLIVDIFKDEVFFELYDLKNDPQETHNLAFEAEDTVHEWSWILQSHMIASGDRLSFRDNDYARFLKHYSALCTPVGDLV